jgi:hypothetical protein
MRQSIKLFTVILFCSLTALAQAPDNLKRFEKDGLVFDYQNNWTLDDKSNSDAQQLTLARPDSDAQIRIFVFRDKVDTSEKIAEVKTELVNPYIEATSNGFVQMGAKPTRTPATIEIAGAQAEGVRIGAVLDGMPGEAAIYWTVSGNRLIVLTLFGPDPALKKAAPVWDTVRASIRIQEPTPAATPAKPK